VMCSDESDGGEGGRGYVMALVTIWEYMWVWGRFNS
jgi:hypothetical protein